MIAVDPNICQGIEKLIAITNLLAHNKYSMHIYLLV